MKYKTHLAFSFLVLLLLWPLFENLGINKFVYVALFLFASIVPDIDKTDSKLGRHIKIVGWVFGHRGIFHSIWPMLLFAGIISVFSIAYAFVFAAGYLSHLVLDMMNHQGVGIFFPLLKWRIKGFSKSGGLFEMIFFFLCVFGIVILSSINF